MFDGIADAPGPEGVSKCRLLLDEPLGYLCDMKVMRSVE